MAKKIITVEVQGGTVKEARERLLVEIPEGFGLAEEEIIDKGEKENKRYNVDSSKTKIRAILVEKNKNKEQLYCIECGNIQLEGEWEKRMDSSSRAAGMKGFINLGARPQCLGCGRETLVNISLPLKERRSIYKEKQKVNKLREIPEFTELINLSKEIGFPASIPREQSMMKKVKVIGERLAKKGGLKLMHSVIYALPSAPGHERLWRNFVSASWNGVRDESGDCWLH